MPKVLRFLLSLIGAFIGVGIMAVLKVLDLLKFVDNTAMLILYIVCGIIGFVVFYLILPKMYEAIKGAIYKTEKMLDKTPVSDIFIGAVGAIIGLLIAFLATYPLQSLSIPFFGNSLGLLVSIIVYIIFGVLGARLLVGKREEIASYFTWTRAKADTKKETGALPKKGKDRGDCRLKVVDTSAIIDGRILDIVKTGFLEGPFVVATEVLEELQHIADSTDSVRRERGRRGLDVVRALQEIPGLDIEVKSIRYPGIEEVDAMLVKHCIEEKGKIITTDYNLNKVATLQGIKVLNVNDLANAVKQIVIPGETLEVNIVREGKEYNQGLAYLEDGTMIVINNARKYIGKTKKIIVTSAIQTAAGKMIFAELES